jgi:cytochrome c1
MWWEGYTAAGIGARTKRPDGPVHSLDMPATAPRSGTPKELACVHMMTWRPDKRSRHIRSRDKNAQAKAEQAKPSASNTDPVARD